MSLDRFSPQMSAPGKGEKAWHALHTDEVLRRLEAFADKGLSSEEAARRLEQSGSNTLKEAPQATFWQMLAEQFKSFVVILLIVAAVISALLGDYIEAAAIMAIVILNAALGVVQEYRAEQSLAALRKLAAPEAHVIRDGAHQIVPASQLVPGDLVLLEAGNYVPADLRLLEAVNLRIDEAALTGESVAVQKDASTQYETDVPLGDRKNTVFMGTLVNYGRGRGVVISTGMNTQIGMIAEMLQSVQLEPTPLQRRLDQLGKTLGWAALAVCAIVFFVGWIQGSNPLDMFMIAVSLAIAAVPEGLPAIVTISLALGMREMIKRHALIRRLASVETLGSATTICSDKTGTLTQNEMTVRRVWADGETLDVSGSGYVPEGSFSLNGKPVNLAEHRGMLTALWVAALNNDANLEVSGSSNGKETYRVVGDPTEGALIVAAEKAGASANALNEAYPRLQEVPFDSARKRMVTIHALEQPRAEDISPFDEKQPKHKGYAITMKGAPDIVLQSCSHYQQMDDIAAPLDETQTMRILAANDAMTQDALRVLGVAYRVTAEAARYQRPGDVGKRDGVCRLDRHDRSTPPGSAASPGEGAPCRDSHGNDHRRLPKHGARHRRVHRLDSTRARGADRSRAGSNGRRNAQEPGGIRRCIRARLARPQNAHRRSAAGKRRSGGDDRRRG